MSSLLVRVLLVAVLAGALEVLSPVLSGGLLDTALAQSDDRRGWNPLSPLLKLFGPPKTRVRRDPGTTRKKTTRQRQQKRRAGASTSRPARQSAPRQTVRVRKSPDARRILVVGDDMADGLADALEAVFAQSSDILVIESTSAKSGLAGTEGMDWRTAIGPIVDEKKADVVVVMIGANDYKGVETETGLIQAETEAWSRHYGIRVQAFLNELAQREIPVFWVGLVPMENEALSAHAGKVTTIFRENVSLAGGVFVDIWDTFANNEGQYAADGPDVAGQQRQLREDDGIGFTSSGFRKVAFFVERELRGRLSAGAKLAAVQAITDEPDVVEIGTIIPLYDSRLGATVELAGGPTQQDPQSAPAATPEAPDSLQHRLVVAGEALPAVAGRVDDFRWTGAQQR